MKYNLKPLLKGNTIIIDLPNKLTFFFDAQGNRRSREENSARSAISSFCRKNNINYTIEKYNDYEVNNSNKLIVKSKDNGTKNSLVKKSQ